MTTELTVPSRTTPGVEYRVTVGIDGAVVCSCAASEFNLDCWHVREVKEKQMTSQALEVIKVQPPAALLPTQSELGIISTLAKTVVMAKGHAVPASIDSPAKAAAVMLAGWELGVRPLTALRHMAIVNGRTEPDGQLMAAIVLAKEPDARIEIVELSEERCTMRLRRPSRGMNVEYTATIEDAKRAGLVKQNNPWALYPKDMLRLHATKRLCRAFAPDLVNAISGVEVAAASAVLDAHDPTEPPYIDLDQLPAGALVNEGDDESRSELASRADPETGEVLEDATGEQDAPAEDEAEPESVVGMVLDGGALSRDVWQYCAELLSDVCDRHFDGDWEAVYAAFGGHPEAVPFFTRSRGGKPFVNPMGRTNEESQALAALVQAWLRSRNAPSAPKSEPPTADEPATKAPRAPRARAEKDERLGGFGSLGDFLNWCQRELGLNGIRVREIAGVEAASAPTALLDYEGEAGKGLDSLRIELAKHAAGVVQE